MGHYRSSDAWAITVIRTQAFYKKTLDISKSYLIDGSPQYAVRWLVSETVESVIAANPNAVGDYRAGKDKAFGFLMGQVMKKLGKAGNPDAVRKSLKSKLEE